MNLDNLTYTELREGLAKLPATWYPDLIRAMVEAAIEKKVFLPGGASVFISQVEAFPHRKPKP